jgi:glucoamylase
VQNALQNHWNGQYYQSMLPVPAPPDYRVPYDPNIDVVMAAIYGAVAVTDTKMLATAALLRSQWEDPSSQYHYQINAADQTRGIGPLLGRRVVLPQYSPRRAGHRARPPASLPLRQ